MAFPVLRLDSFGVAEYVRLHDIGASVIPGCLGRESPNCWLGTARPPSESHTDGA